MESKPLNLKAEPDAEPMVRLALQLFIDAAALKADTILLELNMGLHLKEQEEIKAIFQNKLKSVAEFEFKMSQLPKPFMVTYMINGIPDRQLPTSGEIFGNIVSIYLLHAGIPHWSKGEISTPLETINPISKWLLISDDVTRRVELKEIHAT
ncbi:MAG TPA: hypothetical protein VG347_19275 [Verrucomicrobiae bacterium]|nr:hypothetical protein [Verrucomicrobiae bacterium]